MSSAARAQGATGPVPIGTILGNRFQLQQYLGEVGGTELYVAVDGSTRGPAWVRLVPAAGPVRTLLEADLARVMQVKHKNLSALLGLGVAGGDWVFLACEVEDGHTLRQLVDAQKAQGATVGLAGAQTLLGHVATGLAEALGTAGHGGINPEALWLTRGGRVKLAELGLARGTPGLARRGGPAGAPEGLYLSPEVAQGQEPTAASDVYSLGAILYELVTGVPPAPPLRPTAQLAPGLPPTIDTLIARALAPDPRARFANGLELLQALAAATGAGAAPAAPAPLRSFNVAEAAGGLSADAERWLVQKDKLDFGPFSLEQVKAQLAQGAFGPDHLIVDMESGARVRLREHPQLGEFALQAARNLEAMRRAQAEHATESTERTKSRATVLILGVVVVVLVGAGGLFLKNRKDAENAGLASRATEGDVDAFIKTFKLEMAQPKRPTARRAASGGGRGDEFSNDLNLGDVTKGGGDEILSDSVIQKVMMSHYRSLVPCIMEERRRDPGLSSIDIDFVVLGSGKVSAVKINGQQKGAFPACVLGRMQSFGFPKFNGGRTIASWSMSMR